MVRIRTGVCYQKRRGGMPVLTREVTYEQRLSPSAIHSNFLCTPFAVRVPLSFSESFLESALVLLPVLFLRHQVTTRQYQRYGPVICWIASA